MEQSNKEGKYSVYVYEGLEKITNYETNILPEKGDKFFTDKMTKYWQILYRVIFIDQPSVINIHVKQL